MSPEPVFGLLNINKPVGPTSHDVVAIVRRFTGVKKVGHAGTLDPMADGVLVVCLGPATRLSQYAMRSPKQYRARVRLGAQTATYDSEGAITAERSIDGVTLADVEAALPQFRGEIAQIPPMYSAIKQGGKRLYDLARSGQDVQREPRQVTIDRLTVAAFEPPLVTLDVTCSPGTYIRSLAHDLGQALGVGAYLVGLTRTASGDFSVADAVPLEAFREAAAAGKWQPLLLPPDRAVSHMQPVHLDADAAALVIHGNPAPAPSDAAGEGRAYNPEGRLIALVRAEAGQWRPVKVFPPGN